MGSLRQLILYYSLILGLSACNPLGSESRIDNAFGACGSFLYYDVGVHTWSDFQMCLMAATRSGGAMAPQVSTLDISNAPTAQQWGSSVLAPNGKIYGIPFAASGTGTNPAYVLVFNPNDGAYSFISVANPTLASWSSGVLAPDGKIYAFPGSTNAGATKHVLVIDPGNDTASTVITSVNQTTFSGSVVGPTRRLFALPSNGQDPGRLMVIDAGSGGPSISYLEFQKNDGGHTWASAALAPNGKIYAFPRNNHNQMLVLDTTTHSVTMKQITKTGSWVATVLTDEGKLIGVPAGGATTADIAIYDPSGDTFTSFEVSIPNSTDFSGGALGPSGFIYGFPSTQVDPVPMLVIDPKNRIANVSTTIPNTGNEKWRGGTLAPNGKVYVMPTSGDTTTQILVIDPKSAKNVLMPALLSTYLNKF